MGRTVVATKKHEKHQKHEGGGVTKARKAPKARGVLIYSSDKKALKTQKAPKVRGGEVNECGLNRSNDKKHQKHEL